MQPHSMQVSGVWYTVTVHTLRVLLCAGPLESSMLILRICVRTYNFCCVCVCALTYMHALALCVGVLCGPAARSQLDPN